MVFCKAVYEPLLLYRNKYTLASQTERIAYIYNRICQLNDSVLWISPSLCAHSTTRVAHVLFTRQLSIHTHHPAPPHTHTTITVRYSTFAQCRHTRGMFYIFSLQKIA